MKLKVKIKYHNPYCKIQSFGDWTDLRAAKTVQMEGPKVGPAKSVVFSSTIIPLGVSMQLPKYYEALVLPRSSTHIKYNILSRNSEGVIDNEYCGDTDEWGFLALATAPTVIEEGDRICQFRIQLSQRAPWYIKLKDLFFSGFKFVEVSSLNNNSRGGYGQSGKK